MKHILPVFLVVVASACASQKDHARHSHRPEQVKASKNSSERVQAEDQAFSSESNAELTRQIRERLMDDERFSVYAQNVTIVTLDDTVTLRGQVKSRQVTKRKTIDNQLTVVK
jgi:osmotically-inducible protein OsmY